MNPYQKAFFHIRYLPDYPSPRFWLSTWMRVLGRRNILPQFIRRGFVLASLRHPWYTEQNIFPFLSPNDPNEAFLDIGAAYGLHSHPTAKAGYTVYAFEPDPYQLAKLHWYEPSNLHIVPVAVGETTEMVDLHFHEASHARIHHKGVDYIESVPVPCIRLDDYSFKEKVGVIKVDTEGHELAVLKGALHLIVKDKPRLILECHDEYDNSALTLKAFLVPFGYDCRRVYRPTGRYGSYHLICEFRGN